MIIWQAAVEVLKETGNDAVMWGDETLLHLIANRSGRKFRGGWRTSRSVLDALSKTPGPFKRAKTWIHFSRRDRLVRVFRLRGGA